MSAKRDSLRRCDVFKDSIWWLYFGTALRYVIFVKFEAEAPIAAPVLKAVARGSGVPPYHIAAALAGEPVTRLAFRRLCKWMGWAPGVFERARLADARRFGRAE